MSLFMYFFCLVSLMVSSFACGFLVGEDVEREKT